MPQLLFKAVSSLCFAQLIAFTLNVAVAQSPTQDPVQDPVQYNRDVRPILSNNCFFCHGFDEEKRESGLRLDTFEGATESDAIVTGDPEASTLVQRVFSDDPDLVMPPSDSAYALLDEQKDIIKRWVAQGGEYQEHWAYRGLEKPPLPDSNQDHPIDAFLAQTWEQEKTRPAQHATPRQQLRRLSYDLRGLPPSYKQVEAFTEDASEENYQAFIRQWTQSVEYAEHQGLLWLDLVRWADSSGMVSDEPISTGPYRAFVIKAFRDNMPFDQFTREQLAGDLLPDRNDRTLVASGYNRLVKTNSEAGVIEKEALHALKGEHVRAVGTVWMGATTGCAECHDHKYDPMTARDYYSLAAFFDDLIEIGVYDPGDQRYPLHFLHDDADQSAEDLRLSQKVEQLRKKLYDSEVDPGEITAWEEATKQALDAVADRADFAWMPKDLPPSRISSGTYTQTENGREVVTAEGKVAMHMASETMTGYRFGIDDGKALFYANATLDSKNPPQAIAIQIIHGDYQRQGWLPDYFTTYVWGDKKSTTEFEQTVKDKSRVVHVGPLPETGKEVRLVIDKNTKKSSPHEEVGVGWIQLGGKVTWGDAGFNLTGANALSAELAESTQRFWWELPQNRDDREHKMKLVVQSIKKPKTERRQVHRDVIRIAFQESRDVELVRQLTQAYKDLYLLRQQSKDVALVSKTGPLKETRLRNRGNFMDESGPNLDPAVPEFLGQLKLDRRATRLDLANWLMSPKNPLTARVFVNRLWHQFYGRGLCETLEDVGNQGDWPSHPELLDWLAVEFIDSGWDVRHMIQLMVSAQAYRLSSTPTLEMKEQDPSNRLHTRQSRHRHGAEEIRDSALAAAGLLQFTDVIPTKSFFPYQPESYWVKSNKIMFGSRYLIWETDQGASQFQRSLYTFWKRQNPHPSLLAFDAPTRQECTAKRPITNTPGQALALLNDPTFVEASRALAETLLTSDAVTTQQRMELLYNRSLQRSPNEAEKSLLTKALAEFSNLYAVDLKAAKDFLSVGQRPVNESLETDELAAWTAVCRIVLNLHEFVTRS